MHVVENKSKVGKKIYHSVLLRESYRENGKVKKRSNVLPHGEVTVVTRKKS